MDGEGTDGRTDEWRTDGRTDGFQKTFSAFFESYPRLDWIKCGYGPKNVFQPFLGISAFYPKLLKPGLG